MTIWVCQNVRINCMYICLSCVMCICCVRVHASIYNNTYRLCVWLIHWFLFYFSSAVATAINFVHRTQFVFFFQSIFFAHTNTHNHWQTERYVICVRSSDDFLKWGIKYSIFLIMHIELVYLLLCAPAADSKKRVWVEIEIDFSFERIIFA